MLKSAHIKNGYSNPLEYIRALPRVQGAIELSQLTMIPGGGTHDIYKLDDDNSFL